jgi:hypothetical protein
MESIGLAPFGLRPGFPCMPTLFRNYKKPEFPWLETGRDSGWVSEDTPWLAALNPATTRRSSCSTAMVPEVGMVGWEAD